MLGPFARSDDDEPESSSEMFVDALHEFSLETLTVAAKGFEPTGTVGICVGDVTATAIEDARSDLDRYFTEDDEYENPATEFRRDDQFFDWVVFHTSTYNFDRVVDAVHFALYTLTDHDAIGSIVAVLYEVETPENQSAYVVYSGRSEAYYPFAPSPEYAKVRDTQLEGELHDVMKDVGVDIVQDKDDWYPLWPPEPARKPWHTPDDESD